MCSQKTCDHGGGEKSYIIGAPQTSFMHVHFFPLLTIFPGMSHKSHYDGFRIKDGRNSFQTNSMI